MTLIVVGLGFTAKNQADTEAQLRAARSVILTSYALGDLITLKSQMHSFAPENQWKFAEFVNSEGEPVWTFGSKSGEKNLFSLFQTNATLTLTGHDGDLTGTLSALYDFSDQALSVSRFFIYTLLTSMVGFGMVVFYLIRSLKAVFAEFNTVVLEVVKASKRVDLDLVESDKGC